MLFHMKIVDDAVVADATTPRRGLSFEALDIALEGIVLHGKEGGFNAGLIF